MAMMAGMEILAIILFANLIAFFADECYYFYVIKKTAPCRKDGNHEETVCSCCCVRGGWVRVR